jgi:hypothetical protein
MVGKEREGRPNPFIETYASYIFSHSEKIAKTLSLEENFGLNEEEVGATCSFLAERIAKAHRYYQKEQTSLFKKPFFRGLIEKMTGDGRLIDQVCQFFKNNNQKIIDSHGQSPWFSPILK